MRFEGTLAKLASLINQMINLHFTIRGLLDRLGLSEAPASEGPDLADYLERAEP